MKIKDLLKKKNIKSVSKESDNVLIDNGNKNAYEKVEQNVPTSLIGTFIMSPEANEASYLECNGAEYSKEAYPELVELWERLYGDAEWFQGSSEDKFRVPDHNRAGLFMRGIVDGVYQQGDITQSSTKAPKNPFAINETHTHEVSHINPTTKPHNHRIGHSVWVNEEGGFYAYEGGTIPLNSSGHTYLEREEVAMDPVNPEIVENEMEIQSLLGGDNESAPAAFVTKFWVLAKTSFSLPPDTPIVNEVNGMSGDVVLEGSDLANNVYLLNNNIPDASGNVNLNAEDIGAVRTVNTFNGPDVVLQKENIDNLLYSINTQTGDAYLGYRTDIDQQVRDFHNGILVNPMDPTDKMPSEFLLRLRNTTMDPVDIQSPINYPINLETPGTEIVENTWNIRSKFQIDGSVIKLPLSHARISYLIDIRLKIIFQGSGSTRVIFMSLVGNNNNFSVQHVPILRFSDNAKDAFNSSLIDTYTVGIGDAFSNEGIRLEIQNENAGIVTLSGFDILIKGSLITWN